MALLKVGSTRAERRLVVSFALLVPDGGSTTPESAQPMPNTFAYQTRYGGDDLGPVHFVELILEPAMPAKSMHL